MEDLGIKILMGIWLIALSLYTSMTYFIKNYDRKIKNIKGR